MEHAPVLAEPLPRAARKRDTKAARREQLISATIDAIARHGYAGMTLAMVSDGAGLSRGIVNFHFESKDRLLIETMQHMSDEYADNWRSCLAAAAPDTASRLLALVAADLDEAVCTPRKAAAWFAFVAEAKSRPAYRRLCWDRDAAYCEAMRGLCAAARDEAGYAYDPAGVTTAIYAMQEGLWLRLALSAQDTTREAALRVALGMLGTLFPRHFTPDGRPLAAGRNQPGGRTE